MHDVDIDIRIGIRSNDQYPGYVDVTIGEGWNYQARTMLPTDASGSIEDFLVSSLPNIIQLAHVKAEAEREREALEAEADDLAAEDAS